jgi:PAS domain-containing protein
LASQIKIYQEITRGVTELIVVADDYMAYPYERKIGQWRSRYHRLMGAIRLTSDPRLHRLEKRLRSLKALFEKIVLHHGATKNPAPLLTERIIGKMRLVSHEILTGSYHLMDIREAALDKANRANTLFLYILSFLIAAVTIISGFLTVSSITSPLRGILEKARRISIQYEPLQDNNQGARKASGEFEALSKALDLVIEKLLESLDELEAEIRDHQQTLSSLQKSEERFELAMKFTNDGLFDWDIESNEIYYSIGWKKMLGYEDHEIQNAFSEWERLTRPEDAGFMGRAAGTADGRTRPLSDRVSDAPQGGALGRYPFPRQCPVQ